jgi:signal transduction histidine kinase
MSAGIYLPDGRVFATYRRNQAAEVITLPQRPALAVDEHRFEDDALVLFRRSMSGGQQLGTVYIQSDVLEMRARLRRYLEIAGSAGLAAFLLALLSSSRLQRRISQPIVRLAQTARTVTVEKNYAVRAVADSRDELGLLVETFNDMLAQIEQRNADLQTAHDELEQRVMERTAQLETANKELEAFSYSVSHDLRAPLRAVDGFSRILLEEDASSLAPEAQRYLRLIRDNAQQMGQLIDDLLAFSRLSRQPLTRREVRPADLVQQVLSDLRPALEGRHVDLKVDALPACQADPALLKQVYVNLLANAIKFTSKREVGSIHVGCRHENGIAVYFVQDNGVGFDMRYADKLFGVFQRLHRAEEYEGTGVGLAIVQRVIHRHGGRIWAEAAVDQGATFFFTLAEEEGHNE